MIRPLLHLSDLGGRIGKFGVRKVSSLGSVSACRASPSEPPHRAGHRRQVLVVIKTHTVGNRLRVMKSSPQMKDRSWGKCRSNEASRYSRDGAAIEFLDASHDAQVPHEQINGRRVGALNFSSSLLRLPSSPTAVRSLSSSKCSMTSVSSAGQHLSRELASRRGRARRHHQLPQRLEPLPFDLLEQASPIQELLCRVKVGDAMRQYQRLQGNRSS